MYAVTSKRIHGMMVAMSGNDGYESGDDESGMMVAMRVAMMVAMRVATDRVYSANGWRKPRKPGIRVLAFEVDECARSPLALHPAAAALCAAFVVG